jgi:hypothetical protein
MIACYTLGFLDLLDSLFVVTYLPYFSKRLVMTSEPYSTVHIALAYDLPPLSHIGV